MKLMPNGNIEITVQLLPDAYAALQECIKRDSARMVDLVNVGILAINEVSKPATAAGTPLGTALKDTTDAD